MPDNWMHQTERFFDDLFGMIGNIIVAFVRRLAPFAVPAAPAYFFGHAVASAVTESLAVAVGVVAAVGLESAGILAAHYAVRFWATGERRRAWVATTAAGAYLIIGVAAIWGLETATRDAKLTGTAMFLVAGLVYLLLGLDSDVQERQRADVEAIEARQRAAERERQRAHELHLLKARQQHEREMAQVTGRAQAGSSRSEVPATNGHLPGDFRLLNDAHKEQIRDLTTGELVDMAGISASTARRWKRKVNANGSG